MLVAVSFVAAVVAQAVIRIWLGMRQIAAVRTHRAAVPGLFADAIDASHQAKAADYTAARMRAACVGALVAAALALGLTLGGGIAALDAFWRGAGLAEPWLGTAVVLSVLAVLQLVALPFALWRTFVLETRFGFNRTSARLFAADLGRRALVGTAVAAPLAAGALLLMEHAGPAWWLHAWVGWLAVMLVATWAWPRVVAPLFNRFTPLADATLLERIGALMRRCGFAADGVFVMDGSRRSAHGNAYFTGIGRHKRIVLLDTLLERLAPPEVEAVLAHELGHFRLGHVRRRLAASAGMMLAGLALLAWFAERDHLYPALGVPEPSAHAALALFVVAAPVLSFFVTPLAAWWSRRDELAADDFAARHTDAAELASALEKIYRDNAATLTPDPLYSGFYDSHPRPELRVARLRQPA